MYGYLSGYDNLVIQARACGVDTARHGRGGAALVGMQARIKDKFKSYSLGMKQRLGVAQALLHNPEDHDSGRTHQRPRSGGHQGIPRSAAGAVPFPGPVGAGFQPHPPGNAAHVRYRGHYQQWASCCGWPPWRHLTSPERRRRGPTAISCGLMDRAVELAPKTHRGRIGCRKSAPIMWISTSPRTEIAQHQPQPDGKRTSVIYGLNAVGHVSGAELHGDYRRRERHCLI